MRGRRPGDAALPASRVPPDRSAKNGIDVGRAVANTYHFFAVDFPHHYTEEIENTVGLYLIQCTFRLQPGCNPATERVMVDDVRY